MKNATKTLLHFSLLVVLMLLGAQRSMAQVPGVVRCYTDEADSALRAMHPSMESKSDFELWVQEAIEVAKHNKIVGGVYQIPVVFHVIHSGEAVGTGTNVSQAAIQSQIDVLNEDFRRIFGSNGYNTNPLGADTEIEFCLAQRRPDGSAFAAGQPGVNRILYSTISGTAPPFSTGFIDGTIKPWTYNGGVATATRGWVPTKYMNIWLCDISGGILGYAQFPTSPLGGMFNCTSGGSDATDGVVFLYNSIGKSSVTGFGGVYNEGRTATHEIGHWLGLRHIWGDGGCTVDDYCNDTPEAAAANYGCPTINSCTNAPDPGNDMVANYMDYTNDLCMNIFTNDQKQRMRAVLEGSPNRVSLINSDACTPPNPSDASVTDVFSPRGDNCTGSITPSVQLRNRGSNALTSATISYNIDNGTTTTFSWTGTISPGSSATVALPAFTTTLGQHTFKSWSTLPNGVTDPSTTYDTSSISFMVSNGIQPNHTEDFEAETFPPDIKWVVENVNADCRQWTASSGTSAAGNFINNMAMLPFYGNGSTSNENLYTPIFILPCNATAATIDFNVAYRQRIAGSNDRLIVEISQDCGSTWTSIYDKQGSTLAVSGTLTGATEYYPTAANHWRNEVINLISYVGATSKNIRFRFRGIANNGNNIFVDDVRFLATTPGEIQLVQGATEVLDGGYYNFPNTQVGSTSTQTFTINNTGSTNLTLTPPITVTGATFALGTTFGTTTVPAGGSTTFTLTFTPSGAGAFTGTVSFATNDCDEGTYNFTLNGVGTTSPPVADFSATPTTVCQGGTVNFTNLSTNATGYSWSFGAGATPSTSTATNPSVVFGTAGTFPITLTASNGFGSDVETKTGYITVVASTSQALPYNEGFTSTATFPYNGLTIVNPNGTGTTWARTTAAGLAPTAGNSVYFNNYDYNDPTDDELRLPKLDITNYVSAQMTFDVAYRLDSNYPSNIDGLEILVSTDCGGTFTSVYSKSGATLATIAPAANAFTPTAAQWRAETVDLSAYVGQSSVWISFKNLSGYGNRLYVDNINVTGVAATATSSFTVNPNPVCQGQTVTYTSTSTGASSYSWNFGANATPATASTVGPHTVTYSTSGSKTVVLQINGTGPSSNQTVTVNALPAPPTITPSGPTTFCAGGSVTLTSSAGSSYLWSNGATTASINVTTAGTYTVQVTNASGCQSAASAGTTVTVNSLPATPTITPSGPTTFCAGGSVTLTSSAGSSYLWSNGATTAAINVTTAGTYTVQVTNASGCQSAASAGTTVTVNTLPATPTITPSGPTTFCAGGSVTLTSSAGSSYLWSNGATTAAINVTTAGTYTVQVTNASGCQSAASAGTTVTVNALPATPTITPSGPTTFCAGGSVTLTSSAGSSYLWSNGATTQSINVTTAGTYTVQVTNASGCQSAASAGTTVTVNSLPATPTITPSGPTTFCAGGSVTLTSSAGSSYLWSNGATTAAINVTTAGTYTVQVTNASGCQSAASAGTTVTVNALPATPTITPSGPTTFCAGGSVTLTSSAGSSYLWSNGATTASINVTTAGTYTVQVTNASGCQSAASAGTTVTVNTLPATPTITPSGPTTFCAGGSVTLTSSAGSSYLWSNGATTAAINVTTAGTYTVQVTNASGCQSAASAGTTVTVNPTPTIAVGTVVNPTTCSGTDGSIQVTGSGTGDLSWTGTTSGSLTSVALPQTISGLSYGSYNFTFTSAVGCPSNTISQSLVAPTAPSAPTITPGGTTTFCSGGSVTLTSSAGTTYLWSTGETTQSITVTTSGTYTVQITNASGCSSPLSSGVTVTVNPTPTISAGTVVNPSTCGGTDGSIQVTGSGTGDLSWTGTTSGSMTGVTLPQTVSSLSDGSYNFVFTSTAGCVSNTLSQALVGPSAPSAPTITPSGTTTFCSGGSVTLTSSAGTTYLWSTGETTQSITVTTSGTYTVQITNASGCSSPLSSGVTVTVNPTPSAPTITPSGATTFCSGGSVVLTSSASSGNNWSNGGTSSSITVTTSGTYTVTETASGCTSSASAPVVVTVNTNPTVTFGSLSDVCDYTSAFALTGGAPAGGTYSGNGVSGGNFDPATAGLGTTTITYTYMDGNGCSGIATSPILVDDCAGVDENAANWNIYPNPSSGIITIVSSVKVERVEVYDQMGKLVMYRNTATENNQFEIDLSATADGVYTIKLIGQSFTTQKPVVVKH